MVYEFTLFQLMIMSAVITLTGILIGYLIVEFRGGNKQQDEKIRQLEEEIAVLREHKAKVSGHFHKTASLLHEMTGQYKAIYEHMAEGAQSLCDEQESGAVLERLESGLLTKESQTKSEQSSSKNTDKPV